MRIIGIDGGREGAACVLSVKDGEALILGLCRWKKRKKNRKDIYEVVSALASGPDELTVITDRTKGRGSWELGRIIQERFWSFCHYKSPEGLVVVASEDIYVGQNMRASVDLAKFIGGIVSHLEHWDRDDLCSWVKPGAWRKEVLGLGHFTKRDIAKKKSLSDIPDMVQRLPEFLDAVGVYDHCTDAVGVALWRSRQK